MKIILSILFIFFLCLVAVSQTDSVHFIKVDFLYGSKPKRQYRATEKKCFGGIHGGHVTIQVDDVDYGFEPITHHVHIFPRKIKKSDFKDTVLSGQSRYTKDDKTALFIIPVSNQQYNAIKRIHQSYCDTTPFDYAFFGMRCAASARDILAQIGIFKRKNRFGTIITTFYPQRLRRRLFRLAKKNNYQVITTEGKPSRKWERD